MSRTEESTRTFDDFTVILAYVALIAAALFHAFVLLPQYQLGAFNRMLVLAVYAGLGIWRRLEWATTWG